MHNNNYHIKVNQSIDHLLGIVRDRVKRYYEHYCLLRFHIKHIDVDDQEIVKTKDIDLNHLVSKAVAEIDD